MGMKRILILFLIIFTFASLAIAQVYTSSNYTLKGARIVPSGGKANSANYSFNNVAIGNTFGGKAESTNFSLDASPIDTIVNSPTILSIEPYYGSTGYTEGNITFSITADDEDRDSLKYQFSLHDIQIGYWDVIQPWQSISDFDWSTSGVIPGIQSIKLEVSNNKGGEISEYLELYLFRIPIAPPQRHRSKSERLTR